MIVIEKEGFEVIGLQITCLEEALFVKMPKLFKQFYEWENRIPHRLNNHILDILMGRDDRHLTHLIGYEVSTLEDVPDGFVGVSIPKQNYLYELHKGNSKEIYDTFVQMYDYAYHEGFQLAPSEFKIEIHDEENEIVHLYIKLK